MWLTRNNAQNQLNKAIVVTDVLYRDTYLHITLVSYTLGYIAYVLLHNIVGFLGIKIASGTARDHQQPGFLAFIQKCCFCFRHIK